MKYNVILKMEINNLARLYCKMMGCNVEKGYDFSKAKHSTENMCWSMAEISFQFWEARKRI